MKTAFYLIVVVFLMMASFVGGKLWSEILSGPRSGQTTNIHLNSDLIREAKLNEIANCQQEKMRAMHEHEKELKVVKKIDSSMNKVFAILKK